MINCTTPVGQQSGPEHPPPRPRCASPPPSGRGIWAMPRCSRAESLGGLAPVQRSAVTLRQFPAWGEALPCRAAAHTPELPTQPSKPIRTTETHRAIPKYSKHIRSRAVNKGRRPRTRQIVGLRSVRWIGKLPSQVLIGPELINTRR